MQRQSYLSQLRELSQLTKTIKSFLDEKQFTNEHSISYYPYLSESVAISIETQNKLKRGEKLEEHETVEVCLLKLKKAIFSLALQNNTVFIKLFIEKEKDFFAKNPFPTFESENKFMRDKDLIYRLIIRNSVETLSLLSKNTEFKFTPAHIQTAIDNQAETSVVFLLSEVKIDDEKKLEFADQAKKMGNIAILNALLPQDKYPFYYFSEILLKVKGDKSIEENEFYYAISQAYRNSNMQNVETLYQNLLNHIEKEYPRSRILQQLKAEAKKAKADFPFWASQIARYRAHCDLFELKGGYGFINTIQNEISFGLRNFKVIQDICGKGEDKEFKFPPCQPAIDEYYPTCPPPKNFVSMKTLLSYFASQHEAEAMGRMKENASYYNTLSTASFGALGTPCRGRYSHMAPFIEKIGLEAKYKPTEELKYDDDFYHKYELYFKNIGISSVDCGSEGGTSPFWEHGSCNFHETRFIIWEEIEKIHKAVFEMDPKAIQKDPTEFYNQVVTLIWLMGQLTPTARGTGRYVEQWLALAHHFHDLPIPVLKLGFQLDCIDITMNLERYKKLFLHFMEPASLMPSAQKLVVNTARDELVEDFIPLINRMDSPTVPAKEYLAETKLDLRDSKQSEILNASPASQEMSKMSIFHKSKKIPEEKKLIFLGKEIVSQYRNIISAFDELTKYSLSRKFLKNYQPSAKELVQNISQILSKEHEVDKALSEISQMVAKEKQQIKTRGGYLKALTKIEKHIDKYRAGSKSREKNIRDR